MKMWKEKLKKFLAAFTAAQLVFMLFTPAATFASTTTVVGWSFPESQTDGVSDYGVAVNIGSKYLTGVGVDPIQFNAEGKLNVSTDKAARTDHWGTGDYWLVNFSTVGYQALSVSSYQRSSKTGPRDFKLQYSVNNGTDWSDLGGVYALPNNPQGSDENWGHVSELLPSACDNISNVMLRWIVTSNSSAEGGTISNSGTNRIDEIFINGSIYVAPATYSFTYDGNGNTDGSAPVDPGSPYVPGVLVELLGRGSLVRDGYTFTGWNTEANGLGGHHGPGDTIYSESFARVLYAEWEADTYTVSFDSNGGSSVAPIPGVLYDQTITEPTQPTWSGYDFAGWYSNVGLTNLWNFSTDTVKDDMTLYASWNERFTFTFESNGGSAVPASEGLHYGELVPKPMDPTLDGYIFGGWFSDSELTTPWDFFTDEVTGNRTLYAKWEIIAYTVTFDSTGGTAVDPEFVDYDQLVPKPDDPTRAGYDFAGWYPCGVSDYFSLARFIEQPSCEVLGNEWNFSTDRVTEDMTLYAKWEIAAYTITFDSAGGTPVDPITQNYDSVVTAPVSPTRVGYTFTGWTPTVPPTMPSENITLIAGWNVNSYTISFDSAGGTAVAPITQAFGTAVTTPTPPTRTEFGFTGWTPAVPDTMPAENMTLVAGWTVLVPSTPPILPATVAALAPVAVVSVPAAPPEVAGVETTEPEIVTAEEPAEVKGSSDVICAWWWIVGLILLVILAFIGGVIRAIDPEHFVRRYYYLWPPILSAIAWVAHYYLHNDLQPTWFCDYYWFVLLVIAALAEVGYAYLARDKKNQ